MWMIQALLVLLTWVAVAKGQCSVAMTTGSLPNTEPLILNPGVGSGFRYPTRLGKLEFRKGEKVRLVCNGKDNRFVNLGNQNTKINETVATCESNNRFKASGVLIEFKNFECKTWPKYVERRIGPSSIFRSHVDYEIGFELDNNEFIKLIDVCHNPTQKTTLYSKFKLVKEISGGRKSQPRKSFVECPDHDMCYEAQYVRATQIATIGRILGSVAKARQYISEEPRGPKSTKYLAHGHLVSHADWVYSAQKRATYYFTNQAPQWQRCNAYSWFPLEAAVRTFASATNQDLTVYTGVHEIAQLPDTRNVDQNLYLSVASDGVRSIPVPRFYWKVIYNETTQLGTAFVEVNNPYLQSLPASYMICGRVYHHRNWEIARNRTCLWYNCEVDQLRVHVKFPQFRVVGPLY